MSEGKKIHFTITVDADIDIEELVNTAERSLIKSISDLIKEKDEMGRCRTAMKEAVPSNVILFPKSLDIN